MTSVHDFDFSLDIESTHASQQAPGTDNAVVNQHALEFFVDTAQPKTSQELITVLGVGGGGVNAVDYMWRKGEIKANCCVMNTDPRSLALANVPSKLLIGIHNVGAGMQVEVGKAAAEHSIQDIDRIIDGAKLLFVATGLGGGTGSGATPVILERIQEKGQKAVVVVTMPFADEGARRKKVAEEALEKIRALKMPIMVIYNEAVWQLPEASQADFDESDMYALPNEALYKACQSVVQIISASGQVNVDDEDVKIALSEKGDTFLNVVEASGKDRVTQIQKMLLDTTLMNDLSLYGARALIMVMFHNGSLSARDARDLRKFVLDKVEDTNASTKLLLKYGMVKDNDLGDTLRVALIVTGVPEPGSVVPAPAMVTPVINDTVTEIALLPEASAGDATVPLQQEQPEPSIDVLHVEHSDQYDRTPAYLRDRLSNLSTHYRDK